MPRNDPTLMFANSGMVQFKNVFTGAETRAYKRATTAQKCVRAGGKHNDLDNVGYTARHHTFFEMLGNFSFGDYFKDQAIEFAWTLVTRELGLDAKRLSVTVYAEDDQAHGIWKKLTGFPDSRIIRIPTSDNFWAMGDTGPCGPCSEIFFDHGDKIPGGPPGSADADGDRFIEIWNLVFMQFEQRGPGDRVELPKPSIDTGMGLERIAAVLQGTHDNYQTDLFKHLIAEIEEKSRAIGASAPASKGGKSVIAAELPAHETAYRVIADHLRCSGFLIADGVLPSNEGRGYVLRRIMRRAMRFAYQLGCKEPLMHLLVPRLVREMGEAYPELGRAQSLVSETLKLEEGKFRTTLGKGLGLLADERSKLQPGAALDGAVAFRLYDTYGFPLDLTQDVLKREGESVDVAGFEAAMERQRQEARKAWAGSGEAATETVWFEVREATGASEFLGYETETAEAVVRAIVSDGKQVKSLAAGEDGALILNQTPFYGELGGQVGDRGTIRVGKNTAFEVTDTQKRAGDLFVHFGSVSAGKITVGDAVEVLVDSDRRSAIRANHSATHLLHEALRQVLGDHIAQKGSLVAPERLRFDFSHPKPLSAAELAEVEAIANLVIRQNAAVETRLMDVEAAMASGARALFGEKYGDEVRVVSMGVNAAGPQHGKTYSVELCGGTHVRRTGDIGVVRVLGESAVAAGVRRLEAVTAGGAVSYLAEQDERMKSLAGLLRARPDEVVDRVAGLVEERKRLERQLADAKRLLALGGGTSNGSGSAVRSVGDVKLIARTLNGISAKDLRGVIDDGKKEVGSGVVAIVGVAEDGKASIAVGVTADLTTRFSAVDLVRVGAEAMGGKGGGGRPDLAQAGGPDGDKADAAISAIVARLAAAA